MLEILILVCHLNAILCICDPCFLSNELPSSLWSVLVHLLRFLITGVAILDEDGRLLGNLSASDVTVPLTMILDAGLINRE